MADNSGWMPIGEEDVTPAMETAWASMLDAVEMLDAALADPACADQVAARRLWLRGRALLVCAEQTEGDEAARRKLAAVAVLAHYEDGSGRLAVAMAERPSRPTSTGSACRHQPYRATEPCTDPHGIGDLPPDSPALPLMRACHAVRPTQTGG